MGICGICGKNSGMMGPRLSKAKSWLCPECLKKAGGYANAPLNATLDEIRAIIAKNENKIAEENNAAISGGAIYFLQGVRGRKMTVYSDRVVIKTEATIGSFLSGNISDGEKTIYYMDCIGVQFKEAGIQIGYLQLETASSTMNQRNSNFFNENSFTFDLSSTTNEKMKEVYDYVQDRVKTIKSGNNASSQTATFSAADEIIKYKQLLDMGIISQEEFDAKKKQLLGL